MNATILIDGNAVGHHFHHAMTLSVGTTETQAVFGFVKMLRELAVAFPLHDMLTLWDGRAEFRYQLYPGYKSNRATTIATDPKKAKKKEAYTAQRPIIEKACDLLGMRQMTALNLEADDLAGFMSQRLSKQGKNVLLVTGDSDWWQLVNERVTWLDPRGQGTRVTLANFLEMTGYHTPLEYLNGKCLRGDSTDGVPPTGGIGKDTAPVFIAQFKSVEEFWRRCDAGEFVPVKKAHKELWKGRGRENFLRNWKLINLLDAPPPDPRKLIVRPGHYNPDIFAMLCERLYFASIMKDMENFLAPFKKRWLQRTAVGPVAA